MEGLKDFLDNYGPDLARRIENQLTVIHDPLRDCHPDMDRALQRMKKKPFAVQAEVIKAAAKTFHQGQRCVYLAAEMGSGKTIMGIATALLLKPNPRVLVMCPPHLVRKWIQGDCILSSRLQGGQPQRPAVPDHLAGIDR